MAVDNLFKQVNENVGMSPDLIFEAIPAIEMMFNTEYAGENGDTIRFDNLETPDIDSLNVTDYPDACEGSRMHCVGANKIVLQLTNGFDDQFVMETCELSKLESMGISRAQDMLNKFKLKTDKAYQLAKAKKALRDDIISKLNPVTLSGTYSNVWEEMNAALKIMASDNPYTSTENYVAVISKSYYLTHAELKGHCCEFTSGANVNIDPNYIPPHNVGAIVVVPDHWLVDPEGNYYDLGIYVKAYALFWFRCQSAEFYAMTNNFRNKTAYHLTEKWATSYENHDPNWIGNMGILINSTFVDNYVAPTVSINPSVSAAVGATVDEASLIATGGLTSTGLTNPVYTFFDDVDKEVSLPLDTSVAGTTNYKVTARSGQIITEKATFSLVVA